MLDRSSNLLDNVTPTQHDDRSDSDRAAFAAASYVRPQRPAPLTARPLPDELADQGWDNGPILPPFPGPRRSPEAPQPKVPGQRTGAYDREVLGFQYDGIAADAAFGGAA